MAGTVGRPLERPAGPARPVALRVAYVVRSWPRLSQTFVLNEALAVERAGARLDVFSLARADEALVQPQVAELAATVHHLEGPDGGSRWAGARHHLAAARSAPAPYLRALALAWCRPGLAAGYSTATARRCFGHAVRVAGRIRRAAAAGEPVGHLHAHFAHDPALVAMLASRLTGVPFSFTAHARDLYGVPVPALTTRAASASAVITCCRANLEHLRGVLPSALHPRLHLVHHGVDLELFRPPDGRRAGAVPRIVSVGRLVPKKGFGVLLSACASLKGAGRRFSCVVYGEGPLLSELEARRDELGLAGEVTFAGALGQDQVAEELRRADVFVLSPMVTADGDRDGVPNVVGEAMACALPVASTRVGGVPDLVDDGRNGLLSDPGDVAGLAANLSRLLDDADLRRTLGTAARTTVEERFDGRSVATRLVALFGDAG